MINVNRELENLLAELPGIGSRQAKRIIYSLLRKSPAVSNRLGGLIQAMRNNTKLCQETFHYFYSENATETTSAIARDPNRNHGQILIVETDTDLENIEKTETWMGTYFVLGSTIKPSTDPEKYSQYLRLEELSKIIKFKHDNNSLGEIILALSFTVAGDATLNVVRNLLIDLGVGDKVSVLGRGLSTGTSLEYVDKQTFSDALDNRK